MNTVFNVGLCLQSSLLKLCALSFATFFTVQSNAQPSPGSLASHKSAVTDAQTAIKQQDGVNAVARLQSEIKRGPADPHEDLQLGRLLNSVACDLKNQGSVRAAIVAANLALARLARPNGRMSAADSAASFELAGEIHELKGDAAAAIDAYRQAVALNPSLRRAQDRLTHLSAVIRNAESKNAANALLKQRSSRKS